MKLFLTASVLCFFTSAVIARCVDYVDENGIAREKCTKEYVSESTMNAIIKADKRKAAEDAIEKIGKKNGLTDFEIHDLKKELLKEK